ncbi:ArnT family glycosyltransferase [Dyella humicola]|uniref:ArnT family glycosyltransferase n=1 Tax=Dyella humicola TaxID=2992126 RepID=UPI00225475AD|nr:glycosyltransferase family 39 protein [Dyella humicola]
MNSRLGRLGTLRVSPALLMLLLLPLLTVLPAVPIDETRYLSIAWEMRQSGSWITLHLNGFPYVDKPPLLFWMINAGWSVLGISLWSARAMVLLFGMACVELCRQLERRLAPDASGQAAWLLMGFIFFAMFSGVVMFDVTLCFCVLLGFLAIVTYVQTGNRAALLLLFVGSVLGVLAKGPVALLHLALPILAARWWSAAERPVSWRKVITMVLVAVLGGLPALLWAWAAVHNLDATDAHNLLLRQTAGRVVESFAHNRPFWWYLPWVPVLLLPWPILLRWRRVTAVAGERSGSAAARFGLSASVPALFAFCLVSGKQLHYLLPLLPGVALLLGAWLRRDAELLSSRRMWTMVVVFSALWLWSKFGRPPMSMEDTHGDTAIWLHLLSASLIALAALYLLLSRHERAERRATVAMLLLTMALLPILRLQVLGAMDLTGIAQRVASLRERGVPIARSDDEPGLITFLARLPEPLAAAEDPMAWAKQHPDGYFLFYAGRGRVPSDVEDSAKFANGWVSLVSSRAALANPQLLSRPPKSVRGLDVN